MKCRRKSTNIDFKEIPHFLVVLYVLGGDRVVELVYAGPGEVLLTVKPEAKVEKDKPLSEKITVSLASLRKQFCWETFRSTPSIPLREKTRAIPNL